MVNPSTLEEQLIPLPAIHWKALGKPAGSKGYKYRDRSLVSGPCKSAKVRTAQFKVVCRGSGITYSLDEPSQGAVAVTLKLGTDLPYCMSFGGHDLQGPPHHRRYGRSLQGVPIEPPPLRAQHRRLLHQTKEHEE